MGNGLKRTPFTLAINVTTAIIYTRLLLELDKKVTIFGNKAKVFVACRHLSLDRKEVLNLNLMLMLSRNKAPIQLLKLLHILTKLIYCCIIWLWMQSTLGMLPTSCKVCREIRWKYQMYDDKTV